ncbi:hypothetical protein FRC98_07570 [Lujinxingia vulgaris]|uniref:TonB C-terminal domain-containing protein n=1 Tax=Lujinxingia vulgaris TaxID=2600176 RepID=A0A5C6XHB5_9DELT|nr:hypothetical protein [Lujinxingia vulgaris]TXD37542.1 hypothetical protein FRC98_07570 [Lujinxingia vulgaris]
MGVSASVLTHLLAAAALAWVVVPPPEEPPEEEAVEVVLEEWEPQFDEPDADLPPEDPPPRENPPPEEEVPAPIEPVLPEEPPPEEEPEEEENDESPEPPKPTNEAIAVELQNPEPADEEPEDAEFVAEVAQSTDVQMVASETTLEDAEPPEPEEEASAPEQQAPPDAPEYLASESEVTDEDLEGAREDEGAEDAAIARAEEPSNIDREASAPASQAASAPKEDVAPEREPPEPSSDEIAMRLPAEEPAEAPLFPERTAESADAPESQEEPPVAPQPEPESAGVADETLGPARLFGRDMKAYQEVFEERDAERAEEIADARASQRRRLLSGWQGDSAKLRASLQNFVPHIQVGNHTQVNAASAAHATMIARMHRRYIHPQWAEGFVRRIESDLPVWDPLNNLELMARLEIVIDAEKGEVVDVVRLESSGNEFFDGQAIIVAWNVTSVSPVPEEVVSHDGRVYIHWEFARGPRLCGTFGARIFKLTEPGAERQLESP